MTREEAIKILSSRDGHGIPSGYNGGYAEAIEVAIEALKADPKESFYDGYAYCLVDFGWDTVLCRDCKHHEDEEVGMVYCPNIVGGWVREDFYCGNGKRKDEVEE